MGKDDWKYDEDAWNEVPEEDSIVPTAEKQCRNCLHWIDRESPYCSWCGKEQPEEKKKK